MSAVLNDAGDVRGRGREHQAVACYPAASRFFITDMRSDAMNEWRMSHAAAPHNAACAYRPHANRNFRSDWPGVASERMLGNRCHLDCSGPKQNKYDIDNEVRH